MEGARSVIAKEVARFEHPKDCVDALAISPDGQTVATSHSDLIVRLWNIGSEVCSASLERAEAPVISLAFSPDGKVLAAGSGFMWQGAHVRLWDVPRAEVTLDKALGPWYPSVVSFTPGGELVVAGMNFGFGPTEGEPRGVRLWSPGASDAPRVLDGEAADYLIPLAVSGDARVLATGACNMVRMDARFPVRLWNLSDGTLLKVLDVGPGGTDLGALSADASLLAVRVRSEFAKITVYNVASGERLCSVSGPRLGVSHVAFEPQGSLLATSADKSVTLWDAATGAQVAELEAGAALGPLAFSPQGDLLAAGNADGTVIVWKLVPNRN